MIVLPEDEVESGTPNERTPLKGPTGPPAQPATSYSQAPPPYAPTSPISPVSPTGQAPWHPGPPLHSSTTPLANPSRSQWQTDDDAVRGRALRRLFSAWVTAWIVILLWGMFVGTIQISVNEITKETPAGMVYRWWEQGGLITFKLPEDMTGKKCDCSGSPTSTSTPFVPVATSSPPLRPLPIDYPPTILREVVTRPQPEDTAKGTF